LGVTIELGFKLLVRGSDDGGEKLRVYKHGQRAGREGEAIVVKRGEEVEARGGGKQARRKTHQQGVTPYPYYTTGGWYSRVTHPQRRGWTVKHLTSSEHKGILKP
jgi:hypothetical protein